MVAEIVRPISGRLIKKIVANTYKTPLMYIRELLPSAFESSYHKFTEPPTARLWTIEHFCRRHFIPQEGSYLHNHGDAVEKNCISEEHGRRAIFYCGGIVLEPFGVVRKTIRTFIFKFRPTEWRHLSDPQHISAGYKTSASMPCTLKEGTQEIIKTTLAQRGYREKGHIPVRPRG